MKAGVKGLALVASPTTALLLPKVRNVVVQMTAARIARDVWRSDRRRSRHHCVRTRGNSTPRPLPILSARIAHFFASNDVAGPWG